MIRLTHLKISNFKQLREVEIRFPERFCALVEGLNEAGKSTLLESIYFGLYGKGLATVGGLSSLIAHGSQNAEVTLGVMVHDVQLDITRKLRSTGATKARVEVLRPDSSEIVDGVNKTNKEVLAYLNNLDGESLLASCFVQQKKLGGLEELSVAERQKILLRLLDMDRLSSMGGAFRWGLAEKRELDTAHKKFRLAHLACEIAEARGKLGRLERLLAMAKIHSALEEADALNEKARSAREAADSHAAESLRLKEMISRIEALDKIIHLLEQILRAREVITGREQDLKNVLSDLAHIDLLEEETLPALQSELSAINHLRGQIEQVALMEKEKEKITGRVEQLRAAIKKGDDLAGPKNELNQLNARKESASVEKDDLNRLYGAARNAENLKETIERTKLEISQAEQRKGRLSATLEVWRNLAQRHLQASVLTQKLETLNQEITGHEGKVEIARDIQNKRAEIDQLAKSVVASTERELSLKHLNEQADNFNTRKQRLAQVESQLSSSRAELAEDERIYLHAQQANALRRWAVAKRDEDIRSKQGQRNAELRRKVEEARGRQQQALGKERDTNRLLLTGWGLAGIGIVILAGGTFTTWFLIPVGLVSIIAGISIASIGVNRRKKATADHIAAGQEVSQYERGVVQGEADLRARQSQSPLDIEEAKRQLLALGVDEPADADDAESKAKDLGLDSIVELSSQLESKRQEVQRIGIDLQGKHGALEAETQVFLRELNRAKIASVSEITRAICSEQEEQQRAGQSQTLKRREIDQLNATLPAEWMMEDLVKELENCKREQQRIDRELAQIQGVIEAEERLIQDVFGTEKVFELNAAATLIDEIANALANMTRKKELALSKLTQAKSMIPNGLSSADLYRKLDEAAKTVNGLEVEIKGIQARIEAEEEAIAKILQKEQLLDLDDAQALVDKLEAERVALSSRIADVWKAEKVLLERWNITANTTSALNLITGEESRILTEIKRTQDQIDKRADIKTERDRVTVGISSQLDNIANWYNELAGAANTAQLSLDIQKLDCHTEPELLNQTREKRKPYDLAKLRSDQQDAVHSQATEESIASQNENKAREYIHTAKSLLASLGITDLREITSINITEYLHDFNQVASADAPTFLEELETIGKRIYSCDDEATRLEGELLVKRDRLDFEECQQELNNLKRKEVVCDRAGLVLGKVQENILKAVLPSTLNYMCKLLPYLTNGNYHEAQLDEDTYKIRVWDGRAGDYIQKDVFSGATQDQFSLALRLAFALATLPEGLGARPKFIFLDEPTAGFDGERRKAFVELLTRGEVAAQFDQIFLLSPQGVFETNPLPHYIRLANGRVVDESLSSVKA